MSETAKQLSVYVNGTHMMRNGALEMLSDADLAFSPGGDSPKLGDLFKAVAELQHSYTQSLLTKQHDWTYKNPQASLATDVTALTAWFAKLYLEMNQMIAQLSDEDLMQAIDRTNGVSRTVERQIGIYLEAMLIFLGKLVVYVQSMGKPLPPSIQHYIA